MLSGETPLSGAFGYGNDFGMREYWRFVMVQQYVAALAETAIEFPPMQAPASFNLAAVKAQIAEKLKAHQGDKRTDNPIGRLVTAALFQRSLSFSGLQPPLVTRITGGRCDARVGIGRYSPIVTFRNAAAIHLQPVRR